MSKPSAHTPDAFLLEIEEKASGFGLRTLHLTEGGGHRQGLCLLRQELSACDLFRLLTVPEACAGPPTQKPPFPALAPLHRLFSVEAERVRRTRTPCALLLIGIDSYFGASIPPEISGAVIDLISRQLDPIDALGQMDGWLFGIIMPGANLGRAEHRATAIRCAVRNAGGSGPQATTVSIAIAIRSAFHDDNCEAFLKQVRNRLSAAMARGRDQNVRISPPRSQDSCQVTLEERTQLLAELLI